ncbi:Na+/H+ antiporter subunit E [Kurthia massiliensis]|uniref:Na+/H+ antiporter subunit E n=1 Tax=Kurthia massiliensis TaxID=1033739 RepID=UPI00028A34DD|nr:Na+/H+ antiporter subunit E [Kurthia massiliensis]
MALQFLLNLFIAVLWMLLKDEESIQLTTFFTGFCIGIVVLYLMHRFFGTAFYLRRLIAIIKLILLFFKELVLSTSLVLKQVMSPKMDITPGIFTYKTNLKSEAEVTALALLLTLTPGSVVIDISPNNDIFYIHATDMGKTRQSILKSMDSFEHAIKEVTRND